MTRYTHDDFADKTVPGSGMLMDPRIVSLCEEFAASAGFKPRVTSGVRMPEKNAAAGGVKDSSHLPKANGLSCAVDLAVANGLERFKLVAFLLSKGVKRVGVYDRHVHFDLDPTLPQSVLWVGVSK